MSLRARIDADIRAAMKGARALERDTLRMVVAAFQKRELELGRDLTEAEELDVCSKAVKTRQESIVQFEQAGRMELAAKERAEIEIVQRYLPTQRSEAETEALVRAIAAEAGIAQRAQSGQLIKLVMARHKGEVDGKLVQKIASAILQ